MSIFRGVGGRNPKKLPIFSYRIFCRPDLEATSFLSFRTKGGGVHRPGLGSQGLMFLLEDSAEQ